MKKYIHKNHIYKWLMVLGSINLGLIGLIDKDIISILFQKFPLISLILYIAIGFAGIHGFLNILQGKDF